ncbi:ATPase [Aureococcus anophagefferens]|nr:ATPase [Aureococcus anophagefferens]
MAPSSHGRMLLLLAAASAAVVPHDVSAACAHPKETAPTCANNATLFAYLESAKGNKDVQTDNCATCACAEQGNDQWAALNAPARGDAAVFERSWGRCCDGWNGTACDVCETLAAARVGVRPVQAPLVCENECVKKSVFGCCKPKDGDDDDVMHGHRYHVNNPLCCAAGTEDGCQPTEIFWSGPATAFSCELDASEPLMPATARRCYLNQKHTGVDGFPLTCHVGNCLYNASQHNSTPPSIVDDDVHFREPRPQRGVVPQLAPSRGAAPSAAPAALEPGGCENPGDVLLDAIAARGAGALAGLDDDGGGDEAPERRGRPTAPGGAARRRQRRRRRGSSDDDEAPSKALAPGLRRSRSAGAVGEAPDPREVLRRARFERLPPRRQLAILLDRQLLRVFRAPSLLCLHAGGALAAAVCLGSIDSDLPKDLGARRIGAIFFALFFLQLLALSALSTFREDAAVADAERVAVGGLYGPLPHAVSVLGSDLVLLRVLPALLLALVVYPYCNLRPRCAGFCALRFASALGLASAAAGSLALALGALRPPPDVASALGSLGALFAALFGGVAVGVDSDTTAHHGAAIETGGGGVVAALSQSLFAGAKDTVGHLERYVIDGHKCDPTFPSITVDVNAILSTLSLPTRPAAADAALARLALVAACCLGVAAAAHSLKSSPDFSDGDDERGRSWHRTLRERVSGAARRAFGLLHNVYYVPNVFMPLVAGAMAQAAADATAPLVFFTGCACSGPRSGRGRRRGASPAARGALRARRLLRAIDLGSIPFMGPIFRDDWAKVVGVASAVEVGSVAAFGLSPALLAAFGLDAPLYAAGAVGAASFGFALVAQRVVRRAALAALPATFWWYALGGALVYAGAVTWLALGAVLDRVSLSAAPGGVTALLGPSGAGKSSLLDVLAGRRTSGRARGAVDLSGATFWAGRPPGVPRGCGSGAWRRKRRARAEADALALDARCYEETRLGKASGGQRRRVTSRRPCSRRQLLFCDEPATGLGGDGARGLPAPPGRARRAGGGGVGRGGCAVAPKRGGAAPAPVGGFQALCLLATRERRQCLRDGPLLVLQYVPALVVGAILGLVYEDLPSRNGQAAGIQDRLGLAFVLCTSLGLSALSAPPRSRRAARLLARERDSYGFAQAFAAPRASAALPLRVAPPLALAGLVVGLSHAAKTYNHALGFVLAAFQIHYVLAAAGAPSRGRELDAIAARRRACCSSSIYC